jgi:rubrerythrin
MPKFESFFYGPHKELSTTKEIVEAIRFMIASEFEAIQIYQQIARAIPQSNENVIELNKVIANIVREEIVHAGEFLELLKALDPTEQNKYEEGAKEVRDLVKI